LAILSYAFRVGTWLSNPAVMIGVIFTQAPFEVLHGLGVLPEWAWVASNFVFFVLFVGNWLAEES
jgi:hypothetical protein